MSNICLKSFKVGFQMGLKYTRTELAQEIGRSIETVKKLALKRGLKECFKSINNRDVIAYELTEQELSQLKNEIGIETSFNDVNQTIETNLNDRFKTAKSEYSQVELIDKILDYSDKYNQRIETYVERAVKAEQKHKLIEMSEANKDNEINRLNALVKQLQEENKNLNQQLEQERSKPFWKKKVL